MNKTQASISRFEKYDAKTGNFIWKCKRANA